MRRFTANVGSALALGLGLALALVWVLSRQSAPVIAAPTLRQAERPLSDATPTHYVAITGTDSSDCSTPDGACLTIQYAVDQAGEGDMIKMATGTYTDVNNYGGLAQVIYISKTITIQGGYTTTNWTTPYPVTQPTTLDAEEQGRVFFVTGDISPTIEGLRITGGDATNGGGIYGASATITISNCRVFENTASSYGGGLYLRFVEATLIGNTIISNTAGVFGGGLYKFYGDITPIGNAFISNTSDRNGGGLYLSYGDATLTDNTIISNTANHGGGLYKSSGSATLIGNTVISNTANENGGGLYLSYSCTLNDNVVIANIASTGGGLYFGSFSDGTFSRNIINQNTADTGGGLYLGETSSGTFLDNVISDNTANDTGGGLHLYRTSTTFERNVISGNSAGMQGGGLQLYESAATFNGNTIVSNSAERGGGVFLTYRSDAVLINNVVANNRANAIGGGLFIEDSAPQLLHTTIAHNTGSDGSGVCVTNFWGVADQVTITNTILVGHSVGITVASGSTATLEATLWGDGDWTNGDDVGGAGAIITGTHNYWGDPAFVDHDAGDYHISAASAALDRGVNADVTVDIDNQPRPQDSSYDIGADEFYPDFSLAVTKHAYPDLVQAGELLTYTIRVTNTGNVDLHTTVTDMLPDHVTITQPLVWTPTIPAPGGVWTKHLTATVEMGYAGLLTNVVQVTTDEGTTGAYTTTSEAQSTPPNQAPDVPGNPIPDHQTTDVPITQILYWQASDPDGDPMIYTVALGTNNPPPVIATTTLTSYTPALITDTTYYWSITTSDGADTSVGPIWRFTTIGYKRIYLPLALRDLH